MPHSCTRDAIAFATALRRLPSEPGDDERAKHAALASAAAAAGTFAASLVARAVSGFHQDSPFDHPAAAAMDIVTKRFEHAADAIAKSVAGRSWYRVLVAAPSYIVEQSVRAMASRSHAPRNNSSPNITSTPDRKVTATVLGDTDTALVLAAEPGVHVQFVPYAAAAAVMRGCDVVLVGAESVHLDARLVVASGVAVVAALAVDAGIPVHALIQTVKFDKDVLLAETDRPNVEMLDGRFVKSIITEIGEFSPSDAPKIASEYGVA